MNKADIYGITGSVISCILLFLLLWLVVIPTSQQPQDDEGIMVSFGDAVDGGGPVQEVQAAAKPVETSPPPASTSKPVKENLMTQDNNSLAIAEQKKKDREAREAAERERREQARIEAERKRKEQEAIDKANALMGGMGSNTGSTGSGSTSGNTSQGNPLGSGSSGGNSWSLSGRKGTGVVSEPTEIFQEGTVKVEITVDSKGNVISAKATGGNISDQKTRRLVEAAAYKSKFPSGVGEAKGTITYNLRFSNN